MRRTDSASKAMNDGYCIEQRIQFQPRHDWSEGESEYSLVFS